MANENMPFKKRNNPLSGNFGLGSISDIVNEVNAEDEQQTKPVVETKTSKAKDESKPKQTTTSKETKKETSSKPVSKPTATKKAQQPIVEQADEPVVVETKSVEQEYIAPEPQPKVEYSPKLEQPRHKMSKEVEIRDKYTATMERELRINVKIASAKKGLQFSQYIEEAVKEKLEREGL